MSGDATEFFGKGHGDGLGVNEAVSEVEIFAHAGGVDLKFWGECGEMMQGACGEANDCRERFPFCVPGPKAALVVLRLSGENCGDEAWNLNRRAKNCGTSDGVLFVRHGGRTAAARGMWFGEFLHFCLHVEREVVSDFVQRAGEQAKGGGDFTDPVAMRVPGSRGQRKREFLREIFCDGWTVRTEGCKSTDSAAELENER